MNGTRIVNGLLYALLAVALVAALVFAVDVVFLPKGYECWRGVVMTAVEDSDGDSTGRVYIQRSDTDYFVTKSSYALGNQELRLGDELTVCRKLTAIFGFPVRSIVSP